MLSIFQRRYTAMNFRNILWTYAPKKDGTCDVKIYFSDKGKKKYVSTGIKVHPGEWDERKQRVKSSHPLYRRYNAKITRTRLDIERHFLDGNNWTSLFKDAPAGQKISTLLSTVINEGEKCFQHTKQVATS